jgi:hypothetical protein
MSRPTNLRAPFAYTGRKKALLADRIKELCARVSNGEKKATLAREFGINRETLSPLPFSRILGFRPAFWRKY